MQKGVICIVGYNRLLPLLNLISIVVELNKKNGNYLDIIISLDYSSEQENIYNEILKIKEKISIIRHKYNLGLKRHIISCGDLLLDSDYDFLLLLEDDITLSINSFDYIKKSLLMIDDNIAGISLYSYKRSEGDLLDFHPLEDGYDNYYLQFPSSWGQIWTTDMWKKFKSWFIKNDCDFFNDSMLPSYINKWPKTSWKKHFLRYMVHNNKYFFYPRVSLTSNTGIDGENHISVGNTWKVPLLQGNKVWHFSYFNNSKAIYNSDFNLYQRKYYYNDLIKKTYLRYEECPLNLKESILILLFSIKRKISIFKRK